MSEKPQIFNVTVNFEDRRLTGFSDCAQYPYRTFKEELTEFLSVKLRESYPDAKIHVKIRKDGVVRMISGYALSFEGSREIISQVQALVDMRIRKIR